MNSIDGSSLALRAARTGDLAALSALWAEVFGDSEDFISEFYSEIKPLAVMLDDGGSAAAMINVCDISLDGARGGYIYAAAVSQKYRGRGLFTPLMRFCEKLCLDSGYEFLFLIPAGEHLWPLYRHFGYELCETPVYGCADSEILRGAYPADDVMVPDRSGFISRPPELLRLSFGNMLYSPVGGGMIFSAESDTVSVRHDKYMENAIKIYELFSPETISDGIIDLRKIESRYGMIKSLSGQHKITGFGLLLDI